MQKQKVTLLIFLMLCSIFINAQIIKNITGNVVDIKGIKIVGATVVLTEILNSNKKKITSTNSEGSFGIKNVIIGNYNLRVSLIGYEKIDSNITVNSNSIGTLVLLQDAKELKTITIQQKVIRSQQKGDTTEFNANAFKTNPDANAQDLITKMPSIVVENGTVKAQGETVQKITVDGKEFFGDDVALALKNLPAEVIEKIQVFDRQSDQSVFTGFNDGNTQKAINIVTKPGRMNGKFGRLYAGLGTNDRYTAGGNINVFNGKQRFTILGLSNNINQINFGSQDLLGITATQNQGRGGNGGGRNFGGGGNWGGGGNNNNNFVVGNQNGINISNSFGVNYSDVWNKKTTISGSYFFNQLTNNTNNTLQRINILNGGISQLLNQASNSENTNLNNRLNVRIEHNFDSNNAIIFTPKISFQNNMSTSTIFGENTFNNELLNRTNNNNNAENNGYNINTNLLYRHKFLKVGRTVSFNIGYDANSKTNESNLISQNNYFINNDSVFLLNQRANNVTETNSISGSINLTEQITKNGMLMFNYSPSFSNNYTDKNTNNIDSITKQYNIKNNTLSSNIDFDIMKHVSGFNYRINFNSKAMFMVGANIQLLTISGIQKTPTEYTIEKPFFNLLPGAMFNYQFTKQKNMRFFYRTNTNTPSLAQFQTVIDNSNPLILSIGNSNLDQEYSHNLIFRYNTSNTDKGKTFNLFLNLNAIQNYIGNANFLARDSINNFEGIILSKGTQLNKSENLNGYLAISSFTTFGFPVKVLKSNLNLNFGANYNQTPSKINNLINLAKNYTLTSGFALGSNINENIDFSVTYTAFYNLVENTLNANQNNNYFNQISSAKINVLPWKGLVLRSEIVNTNYSGLGNSFNLNYFLWNGGIGYKFLKNNAAEIMLNTFDVLKQNNSINRTVYSNYIEDTQTTVLTRYFMLVFTYNIRSFKRPSGITPSF